MRVRLREEKRRVLIKLNTYMTKEKEFVTRESERARKRREEARVITAVSAPATRAHALRTSCHVSTLSATERQFSVYLSSSFREVILAIRQSMSVQSMSKQRW